MKLLGAEKSIFHAVDKYLFSFKSELLLHKNVNAFVIVAEEFRVQYEHYKKPILFVPHGIPAENADDSSEVISIPCKDYVFYMGMIDGRLDYKLILKMVSQFPNEKFLFLGNFGNVNSPEFELLFIKKKFKNLIHMPAVHALKLKYFIKEAKCCIAPMKQDWDGNMISHHKILHYLAFGKAVFSPVFSAYSGFSNLLYMENDSEVSLSYLKNFLEKGEDSELTKKGILLAGENTYESHAKKILDFINGL